MESNYNIKAQLSRSEGERLAGAAGSAKLIKEGVLDVPEWNCKIPFEVHEITELEKLPGLKNGVNKLS